MTLNSKFNGQRGSHTHKRIVTKYGTPPLTAAVVAGTSAVVAIQMRLAWGRSASQTAFAVVEEEASVSKPIVRAVSVRREEPCSA